MSSYAGRVLHIDLSTSASRVEETGKELRRKYLGGVGMATRLLYDNLKPGSDPLGPDNVMAFATSAVGGTLVPASNKHAVATKSPLTGFIGDSLASSYWSQALKHAGYDAIVIHGQAPRPTYLYIRDSKVEFRDATSLWGMDSYETEAAVRSGVDESGVSIASIGPAGERLVRYACITNDSARQLGRTGPGAVMGSKRLKAIAIRGTKGVRPADPAELYGISQGLLQKARGSATEKYRLLGTVSNVLVLNRLGILPTRNFQQGTFEGADRVSGEYMSEHFRTQSVACASCPIACEQIGTVKEGPYAGTTMSLDYETLYALGPCCGIDDLAVVLKAAELCDRYGLDTMSAGVVVAWAMEAFEKGILGPADAGGLDLRFGNGEALVQIIGRIARREGIGDLLAEGVKRAAATVGQGSEAFAMHSKGLEMPGYDVRGLKTFAMGLAVGTRGSCHNRSPSYEPDMKGKVDRLTAGPGRGALNRDQENFAAVLDSLVICKFMRGCFGDFYPEAARMYSVATGEEMSADELRSAGERICNLKKAFNIREGWAKSDDWLPERFLKEALPEGASQGSVVDSADLEMMIADYYQSRGWDSDGKIPRDKLLALGMEDIAEEVGV